MALSVNPTQEWGKIFFQTQGKYTFSQEPLWYRNFIYAKEKERGYNFQEDLFSPGVMVFACEAPQDYEIICACSVSHQPADLATKWQQELARRVKLTSDVTKNTLQQQLHQVGQSFITKSNDPKQSPSLVAGYHWFLEWGRDAMIALPGLTLYSGKEELCLAVLQHFARYEKQGLIPNFLGIAKEDHAYNTVDASLWFVWAVQQYYLKTNNLAEVIKSFWPVLKNIFKFYHEGTWYNIQAQYNGLLFAGNREINLTWMDAMVDGKPVTPRYGYQVEVNALWFNLLGFMVELASKIQDGLKQRLQELFQQVELSFRQVFWCEERGYLYDFVNAQEKNLALRPNQIFAVSLPYSPLLIKMAVSTIGAVKKHLLTPYGLRTLAQYESGYAASYRGNQQERDYAYHNGTVWPWLLGHFTEALLRIRADRNQVLTTINPCLKALTAHLAADGIWEYL